MIEQIKAKLNLRIKEMMMMSAEFAAEFFKLNPSEIEIKHFPKNTFLVKHGEHSEHMFYVLQGCIRTFVYDSKSHEVTTWFTFENQPIFSPLSYLLDVPAYEALQAIEDTQVMVVHKKSLEHLTEVNKIANLMYRKTLENTLMYMTLRNHSLLAQFAEERYHDLVTEYPNIIQRVPLSYVATYLGVKIETLSRIRRYYKVR